MKNIYLYIVALFLSTPCFAQVVKETPIVNEDHSVKFLIELKGVDVVKIDGSMFVPKYKLRTKVTTIGTKTKKEMVQNGNTWSYTTDPLQSDMYTYSFYLDDMPLLDPNNPHVVRDVADTLNYFIIRGGIGEYFIQKNVPHGRLEKVWYPSSMEKWERRRMSIYTPPGYSNKKSYPVLYLLHGSGGDEDAWETMGRVCQILDNMISGNKITPLIVVMPNGNVDLDAAPGKGLDKNVQPSGVNVNSMLGEMETTFINDIVKYVDKNYPTIKEKSGRAIAGLSLGGLHTLYITLNNPTYFDYIGLFSAQTTNALTDKRIGFFKRLKGQLNSTIEKIPIMSQESKNKKIDNVSSKGEHLDIYEQTDEKMEKLFSLNPKLFYIAVGEEDFVKKLNDDLRAKMDDNKYSYVYNETEGGHTWSNWRKYLIDFLPRIFNN